MTAEKNAKAGCGRRKKRKKDAKGKRKKRRKIRKKTSAQAVKRKRSKTDGRMEGDETAEAPIRGNWRR
ncbi:hypothetical protein RUM43_008317 [Polyplax serrata]|uniref:Uncharacterized protein n=1 Tax=Polyplax serrata TaxID=468196 RepID=A0AAN8PAG3_POLSC